MRQAPPPYPRPVPDIEFEEDILLPGSKVITDDDDRDDPETVAIQRAAKRRRIENAARAYLRGEELSIISASLRGPLSKPWKNPWSRKSATKAKTIAGGKPKSRLKSSELEGEVLTNFEKPAVLEHLESSAVEPTTVPDPFVCAGDVQVTSSQAQKVKDWLQTSDVYSNKPPSPSPSSPTPRPLIGLLDRSIPLRVSTTPPVRRTPTASQVPPAPLASNVLSGPEFSQATTTDGAGVINAADAHSRLQNILYLDTPIDASDSVKRPFSSWPSAPTDTLKRTTRAESAKYELHRSSLHREPPSTDPTLRPNGNIDHTRQSDLSRSQILLRSGNPRLSAKIPNNDLTETSAVAEPERLEVPVNHWSSEGNLQVGTKWASSHGLTQNAAPKFHDNLPQSTTTSLPSSAKILPSAQQRSELIIDVAQPSESEQPLTNIDADAPLFSNSNQGDSGSVQEKPAEHEIVVDNSRSLWQDQSPKLGLDENSVLLDLPTTEMEDCGHEDHGKLVSSPKAVVTARTLRSKEKNVKIVTNKAKEASFGSPVNLEPQAVRSFSLSSGSLKGVLKTRKTSSVPFDKPIGVDSLPKSILKNNDKKVSAAASSAAQNSSTIRSAQQAGRIPITAMDEFDLDAAVDDLGSFLSTWDEEIGGTGMELAQS